MKKRSKLLTLVSILVIIGGAVSLIGSLITLFLPQIYEQSYSLLGMEPPSLLYRIFMTLSACICTVVGIMGIKCRTGKSILVWGLIYTGLTVINVLFSFTVTGFSVLAFTDFIFPALYLWGWYLSE